MCNVNNSKKGRKEDKRNISFAYLASSFLMDVLILVIQSNLVISPHSVRSIFLARGEVGGILGDHSE